MHDFLIIRGRWCGMTWHGLGLTQSNMGLCVCVRVYYHPGSNLCGTDGRGLVKAKKKRRKKRGGESLWRARHRLSSLPPGGLLQLLQPYGNYPTSHPAACRRARSACSFPTSITTSPAYPFWHSRTPSSPHPCGPPSSLDSAASCSIQPNSNPPSKHPHRPPLGKLLPSPCHFPGGACSRLSPTIILIQQRGSTSFPNPHPLLPLRLRTPPAMVTLVGKLFCLCLPFPRSLISGGGYRRNIQPPLRPLDARA